MMNPTDLLVERQRDYAKALDRHLRASEACQQAQERVQDLERDLIASEDDDRRALGDALVDGRKPPAGKSERARSDLEKAKAELTAAVRGGTCRPGARPHARRAQERLVTPSQA